MGDPKIDPNMYKCVYVYIYIYIYDFLVLAS